MYVELDTVSELSLALIGFSALIAMFRRGSIQTWEPRPRVAFWAIVAYGLGALVFALLPSILRDLGIDSWILLMVLLALFHLSAVGLFLRRHFLLNAAGDPTLNPVFWLAGGLMGIGTSALLIVGLAGGLGGPSYRLYHVGVVSCLLVASASFVGVLRLRSPAA